MGEAKRRRHAGDVLVAEGPLSYEAFHVRLEDIRAASLWAAETGGTLTDRNYAILIVVKSLLTKTQDPSRRTMLCMTCDHEFAHDKPPVEIMIALSWANSKHPPVSSPVCAACAAADEATKTERLKKHMSRMIDGARFDPPGSA